MHTEETSECRTPIQSGSGTYGSVRRLSPSSLFSSPTSGRLIASTTGMTGPSYMSNTTGRKQLRRISHMNSSGISSQGKSETLTTITGHSTSLESCPPLWSKNSWFTGLLLGGPQENIVLCINLFLGC